MVNLNCVDASVAPRRRRLMRAIRIGSLLLSAAWVAGAALAAEPGSSASGADDARVAGRSQQAQKQDGSEPLELELAGARREIELLQHLSVEHERAERLAQDLASARRDLDAQAALVAKANDGAAQIKKSSEAAVADLKRAAQKERERSDALAADLAKVRLELDASQVRAARVASEAAELRGQISSSGPVRQLSSEDKDRIAALERDLTAARNDLDGRTTLLAKVRDEAAQLKKVSESRAADINRATQKERERGEALAGELLKLRADLQAERGQAMKLAKEAAELRRQIAAATTARQGTVTETERIRQPEGPRAVVKLTPDEIISDRPAAEAAAAAVGLLARASSLLGQGDILAARTVLERAAEMGSAQASFALAETYDPSVLAKWGTYGTRGDAAMARDLYAKAGAGGVTEARKRAEALRR